MTTRVSGDGRRLYRRLCRRRGLLGRCGLRLHCSLRWRCGLLGYRGLRLHCRLRRHIRLRRHSRRFRRRGRIDFRARRTHSGYAGHGNLGSILRRKHGTLHSRVWGRFIAMQNSVSCERDRKDGNTSDRIDLRPQVVGSAFACRSRARCRGKLVRTAFGTKFHRSVNPGPAGGTLARTQVVLARLVGHGKVAALIEHTGCVARVRVTEDEEVVQNPCRMSRRSAQWPRVLY